MNKTLISILLKGGAGTIVPPTPIVPPVSVYDYPAPATALNHKLTLGGTSTQIAINPDLVQYRACKKNAGVSLFTLNNYPNGVFNSTGWHLSTDETQKMKDLKIPCSRAYNMYFDRQDRNINLVIDQAADYCARIGMDQSDFVICLEQAQFTTTAGLVTVETYTAVCQYILTKGYKFRLIEIANEPQYCWSQINVEADYAAYVRPRYDAIKAVSSEFKVIVAINRKSFWTNTMLGLLQGKADYIAPHWYGAQQNMDSYTKEQILLADNWKYLTFMAFENVNVPQILGHPILQWDTEWRLLGGATVKGIKFYSNFVDVNQPGSEYNPKNGNMFGTLYDAIRLIYNIRDHYSFAASRWLFDGVLPGSILPKGEAKYSYYPGATGFLEGKTSYEYWLYYYMNRDVQDLVVNFTGSAPSYTGVSTPNTDTGEAGISYTGPATPVLVTRSVDANTLHIVVANGTGNAIDFKAALTNFNPTTIECTRLHDAGDVELFEQASYQDDTSRFLSHPTATYNGNDVSIALPGYSVTFIKLTR